MQFNRIYQLMVGVPGTKGNAITDLRLAFQIEKDSSKQTNTAKFDIYNCSPATRKIISTTDSVVNFKCGYAYESGVVQAFLGYITFSKSEMNGADMVTTIEAGDGQVPLRDSVSTLSFAAGATGTQIIAKIAADMGLVVKIMQDVALTPYPKGFSYVGYSRDALNAVCQKDNCRWSIQGNTIVVMKQRGNNGKQAFEISARTGLIGTPAQIDISAKSKAPEIYQGNTVLKSGTKAVKGWRVRCLINAAINPGDVITVVSKTINSWFVVDYVKHMGDTWGNDWISEIECYDLK